MFTIPRRLEQEISFDPLRPQFPSPALSGMGHSLHGARPGLALVVRAYLAAYHRLQFVGRENLPAKGGYVLVSNHTSHLDAICLRAALPRDRLSATFTAAAQDYFTANSFRRLSAVVLANSIPLSRRVHIRDGLRQCRLLLAAGATLIYFPEGTRAIDGKLAPFRPGVGALIDGANWPVVPCAIQGSFSAWPKGNHLARPYRITVKIGQPRHYGNRSHSHQAHHDVSQDLRSAVEALLCN